MLSAILAVVSALLPPILAAILNALTQGDRQQQAAIAPINASAAVKQNEIAQAAASAPTSSEGVIDALRKGEF